jgi:hypothetical protein
MNINEPHFIHQVRLHLNRGLTRLEPTTLDRLAAARAAALAGQKRVVRQTLWAEAGAQVGHFLSFDGSRSRRVMGVLALLTGLLLGAYWHGQVRLAEVEELDSELLSDELPINAYLDKGFDTWLKHGNTE